MRGDARWLLGVPLFSASSGTAHEMNIILLLSVTILLSAGQFLFKRAGLAIQGVPLLEALITLATLPSFYLALTFYGAATLMWIYVLSRIPLIEASPWIAAATAAIPLIGWYFYNERVSPMFWAGLVLMLAGLFLTQIGSQR
jgi:drug/metabolite transporter (DMT)-like permease